MLYIKVFVWTLRKHFCHFCRIFFAKSQEKTCSNFEKNKFQNRLFMRVLVWTCEMQIWQLWSKFYAKCQKTAQNTITQQKGKIFWKLLAFNKVSVWRRRRQFWQLCRIIYSKSQEKFCSNFGKKQVSKILSFHQSVRLIT